MEREGSPDRPRTTHPDPTANRSKQCTRTSGEIERQGRDQLRSSLGGARDGPPGPKPPQQDEGDR
jgi:hypothetical protein